MTCIFSLYFALLKNCFGQFFLKFAYEICVIQLFRCHVLKKIIDRFTSNVRKGKKYTLKKILSIEFSKNCMVFRLTKATPLPLRNLEKIHQRNCKKFNVVFLSFH